MRRVWRDKLRGGRGDKLTPADVDPEQLRMGIAHEMEHTRDRHIATEIAIDHLAESATYYSQLARMEAGEFDGTEGGSNLLLWVGLAGGLGLAWYLYTRRGGA